MYNLYKLTNYKYTNYTLKNSFCTKHIYVDVLFYILYIKFLSLTVFQLIAMISYVIPLTKNGFTIFTSYSSVNCVPSQFLKVQWRVPTLLITRYDPRSLACSFFLLVKAVTLNPFLLD